MRSDFESFLKDLESRGLYLARDLDTNRLVVVSSSTPRREQQREDAAAAPSASAAREEEQEQEHSSSSINRINTKNSNNGGRLLLQSGTAGGSLGGSAPLTPPISAPRPGGGAGAAAGGGGRAGGGGNGTAARPAGGGGGAGADPARFAYSGPAVGVTVPNSVARVLPQLPPNFNGTRPIVVTNPLTLLANGVYQGNIYSGGTSRSPALATVPTPTPPAPVMVYNPGDPINVVRVSSGISDLTNANAALSVVSNWPFNDFRNNFPNQNVASAGSLRTLFCATPLTQWCTNTLPIDPSLVNSVFQGTQNPNFLIG